MVLPNAILPAYSSHRLDRQCSGSASGSLVGYGVCGSPAPADDLRFESLCTPSNGPRSRTLAGFDILTDDILTAAAGRAQRPFDLRCCD